MSRLHHPKAGFWIRVWVGLVYPIAGLLFKIDYRHLDRMPPPDAGGTIIAINHVSTIDPVLMARLVWSAGRIPRFMVKVGVLRWPVIGPMLRGAGQIPVHRGTENAADSLNDAAAALGRGESVVIYPEGTTTRDPDNWPMRAKTGIARLALLCPDAPVVPVGQWGAQHGSARWRRRPALASVGEPLDLTRFRGQEPTGELLREITDVIMGAVRDEVAGLRGETPPAEFFVPTRSYVDRA
jgi:1-acyl-sn-glycerol-3-phosphate acyltransferase